MFKKLWFRRSDVHGLGGISFGIFWFTTLLLPAFMVLSSVALVVLWLMDSGRARDTFALLWIVNALSFVFTTVYALLIDPETARRSWRQSFMFPGVVSLVIMMWACFPALFHWSTVEIEAASGLTLSEGGRDGVILAVYVWVSVCMLAAYLARRLDKAGAHRLGRAVLWFVGFGPLLCAVTVAAYVQELRGADQVWDKTEKVGRVASAHEGADRRRRAPAVALGRLRGGHRGEPGHGAPTVREGVRGARSRCCNRPRAPALAGLTEPTAASRRRTDMTPPT